MAWVWIRQTVNRQKFKPLFKDTGNLYQDFGGSIQGSEDTKQELALKSKTSPQWGGIEQRYRWRLVSAVLAHILRGWGGGECGEGTGLIPSDNCSTTHNPWSEACDRGNIEGNCDYWKTRASLCALATKVRSELEGVNKLDQNK